MSKAKEILIASLSLASVVIISRYVPQIEQYLNLLQNASQNQSSA